MSDPNCLGELRATQDELGNRLVTIVENANAAVDSTDTEVCDAAKLFIDTIKDPNNGIATGLGKADAALRKLELADNVKGLIKVAMADLALSELENAAKTGIQNAKEWVTAQDFQSPQMKAKVQMRMSTLEAKKRSEEAKIREAEEDVDTDAALTLMPRGGTCMFLDGEEAVIDDIMESNKDIFMIRVIASNSKGEELSKYYCFDALDYLANPSAIREGLRVKCIEPEPESGDNHRMPKEIDFKRETYIVDNGLIESQGAMIPFWQFVTLVLMAADKALRSQNLTVEERKLVLRKRVGATRTRVASVAIAAGIASYDPTLPEGMFPLSIHHGMRLLGDINILEDELNYTAEMLDRRDGNDTYQNVVRGFLFSELLPPQVKELLEVNMVSGTHCMEGDVATEWELIRESHINGIPNSMWYTMSGIASADKWLADNSEYYFPRDIPPKIAEALGLGPNNTNSLALVHRAVSAIEQIKKLIDEDSQEDSEKKAAEFFCQIVKPRDGEEWPVSRLAELVKQGDSDTEEGDRLTREKETCEEDNMSKLEFVVIEDGTQADMNLTTLIEGDTRTAIYKVFQRKYISLNSEYTRFNAWMNDLLRVLEVLLNRDYSDDVDVSLDDAGDFNEDMRGAMIGEDGLVVPNLSPGTEFFDRDLSPIQGSRLDFGDDAIDNVETTGHSMPNIQGSRLDFGDDDDDLPDDEIENMIQAFEAGDNVENNVENNAENNAENGGAAKKKGRKRTKKAKTKRGRRSTKKR